MHFSAYTLAAATLLSSAAARITGFAVPDVVAPDSTVKIQIIAENYIQAVQDVAISFGIAPEARAYPGALGTLLSSKFLGPDDSNVVGNITHYVHIPATAEIGPAVITGGLFALYGVLLSPTVETFGANITVGNYTSANYVLSEYQDSQ